MRARVAARWLVFGRRAISASFSWSSAVNSRVCFGRPARMSADYHADQTFQYNFCVTTLGFCGAEASLY